MYRCVHAHPKQVVNVGKPKKMEAFIGCLYLVAMVAMNDCKQNLPVCVDRSLVMDCQFCEIFQLEFLRKSVYLYKVSFLRIWDSSISYK